MKTTYSGLFYTRKVTQNESTVASKHITKVFQLKEKFCYLKNKLTYSNKNSKTIFLCSSFLKNHEISFFLLQKRCIYSTCCFSKFYNLSLVIKLNLHKPRCTAWKIAFLLWYFKEWLLVGYPLADGFFLVVFYYNRKS